METLDEIWSGDLFDRQREAADLVGYLESVAGRPAVREDGHAHVLAVDAKYGHGKTFFLKRLERHLKSTDHVSAYIDAWRDDLEDQPMVALAATLERALEPWVAKSGAVATGFQEFKDKAGRLAKIVGIGLAKRGAGFIITQGAAEALSGELTQANEVKRDITKDALVDNSKSTVDELVSNFETVTASMDARIQRFKEGQAAIEAMKISLRQIVVALEKEGMNLPITIIVDELDRCRPTYAIKVLEEIKHLFDVQGVAFILGMHGNQLQHSVGAAYGQLFDSPAYLRRFFNRRYSLKEVSLNPLVKYIISSLNIETGLLTYPKVIIDGHGDPLALNVSDFISDHLKAYELSARDAFGVIESLQTALALVGLVRVNLSYLLPLIISRYLGDEDIRLPEHNPNWEYSFGAGRFDQNSQLYSLSDFIGGLDQAAKWDDRQLSQAVNSNDLYGNIIVNYGFTNGSTSYNLMQNYRELSRAVARFS